MIDKTPWELHPDLTEERLVKTAKLIARGRDDALARFDPSVGDDGWTLGCRAFQFARFRILEAAETSVFPWLSILDSSKQLIFKIGEVPVRFYHGRADDPSDRTLRQSFPELHQLAFSFYQESEGRDLAFRFAIDTDSDHEITSIKFVGLRGEAPVLRWEVPLAASAARPYAVHPTAAEGVELPAPTVTVLRRKKDKVPGIA
jgi:hypothetical protein